MGIDIGLIADARRSGRGATLSSAALVLLPMCLEGVVPELTFNRAQVVTVQRVLAAPESAVEASLAGSPRIRTALPPLLFGATGDHPVSAHWS